MTTKKILLVADYGQDDLAFKEVQQRLYDEAAKINQSVQVDIVSVGAFNTAETAAVVAKAVEDGRYDVVYHNTAPRKDQKKGRVNNEGEPLAYAKVENSHGKEVQIVGVNSGNADTINTFFLLPSDTELFAVNCSNQTTQFRSRNIYPEHVIKALNGTIDLKDQLTIPQPENDTLVSQAKTKAEVLLADAYNHQLSRHGNSAKGYITIIGAKENAESTLDGISKNTSGAEVDFIPLKSSRGHSIEAGFVAAQLAFNSEEPGKRTLVALTKSENLQSTGELFRAELDNGARIITDDVSALVFAKDRVTQLVSYKADGRAVTADDSGALHIGGRAEPKSLAWLKLQAKLPEDIAITPAYTDGYGNVKLVVPHSQLLRTLDAKLNAGERVTTGIDVGNNSVDAQVAGGSFAVEEGNIALSRGSSGWKPSPSAEHPEFFAEIFKRGGNAAEALGYPQPGDSIRIARKNIEIGAPPQAVIAGGDALTVTSHAAEKGVVR